MRLALILCLLTLLLPSEAYAHDTHILTVSVLDEETNLPVAGAVVAVQSSARNQYFVTDMLGVCRITIIAGQYRLLISFLGYTKHVENVSVSSDTEKTIILKPSVVEMNEVVVTATESRGMTSSSRIGQDAMEHLQPSSFSDLLELLPGGFAASPVLGKPNLINLRAVPVESSNDAASSLGTQFVVDGHPVSTNANLQYMAGAHQSDAANNRNIVSMGVDMRTISTDNIENLEIVRGIPSVEYGDLTSGLVRIERKRGGRHLDARFKADMSSKLYYAGKGFENSDGSRTFNIDADMLDSKSDPRNKFENYRRMNGSMRFSRRWQRNGYTVTYSANFDYGGSFDNEKTDPDISYGNIDSYKSVYSRFATGSNLRVVSNGNSIFRRLELNTSLLYEKDRIERTRFVQLTRGTPAPVNMEAGEHNGIYLPYTYTAYQEVDGQPFNAYVKAMAIFRTMATKMLNELKLGTDWSMDKNYGEGQIFDPYLPCFTGISIRQRKYSAIPAMHQLAFYGEDYAVVPLPGNFTLSLMAGVRVAAMLNLGSSYAMQGRFYADPRINIKIALPPYSLWGEKLTAELTGGAGWHTKFPAMAQLFPAPEYMDYVQLNYYHNNPDYRRLSLMTYIIDPTNYGLQPARNRKYELRADVSLGENRLSVTWFNEDMRSGFRYTPHYNSYTYREYDFSSIDHTALQAPPSTNDMQYEIRTVLGGYTQTTNGSRTLKNGVEFTFSSKRIEVIRTRLTVTGALLRSDYDNSQPVYYKPTAVMNNRQLEYAGLYRDGSDGYIREQFNSNFMFDTDVSVLGLRFSASFQCLWFTANQTKWRNGIPTGYIDETGAEHPFTEELMSNPRLQKLVREYSDVLFARNTVPFCMNVNLKATKKLYRNRMAVALFVNKLLNCNPDYVRNGSTIRRSVSPYFGMEINFNM